MQERQYVTPEGELQHCQNPRKTAAALVEYAKYNKQNNLISPDN